MRGGGAGQRGVAGGVAAATAGGGGGRELSVEDGFEGVGEFGDGLCGGWLADPAGVGLLALGVAGEGHGVDGGGDLGEDGEVSGGMGPGGVAGTGEEAGFGLAAGNFGGEGAVDFGAAACAD